MENAGVVVTTVDQIISELAIDWTSPERPTTGGDSRIPTEVQSTSASVGYARRGVN
jgi:hypothetical protein